AAGTAFGSAARVIHFLLAVFGVGRSALGQWSFGPNAQRRTPKAYFSASAPVTISAISFVMAAWRARFIDSVSVSIISPAFSVAADMLIIRCACSLAIASTSAR